MRTMMMQQRLTHVRSTTIALCFVILAMPGVASAQEKPKPIIYHPVGAPANPKVPAHWNRYHSHAQATKILRDLAKAYPKLCKLQSIGKSYGKRDMWVMTITDSAVGDAKTKPGFWIDGGIHANEVQAVEVVLYTAWFLAEAHAHSEFLERLLRERVIYLMPMMSPDARDAHMQRPNTTHSPRTGMRPRDDDRDSLIDEDGPDDLDGDGHITQMRIRDPLGRYKPHPDFPQLLIRAAADEKGQYTLLGPEGFDNDGDGKVNEDGDGYYDPNRDWPSQWQPAYIQRGAHHYPLAVPENRMVADFVAARRNIAGMQSYHNTGGMILHGPGVKGTKHVRADQAVYNEIARKGELMLPGYKKMNVAEDLYEVYGGEFDWFHSMQGIFGFTNELFTPFNYFRRPVKGGFFGAPSDARKFNKYLLLGEGVVKWHEVDHPQFGKIEVGGLKKNWRRQPPSFLLEEECHRNMAFTLYHADQMPLVKVEAVDVKPLAGGLFRVTARVVNNRLTPTHAANDIANKITPPDVVTITGKEIKVLTALQSGDLFMRYPQEQRRKPETVRVRNIPGMRAVYLRWIVKGAGPYTVTVRSIKGGSSALQSGGK